MTAFDRRLTPARPDLAAEFLRGEVEAAAFVAGQRLRVTAASAALRRAPDMAAGLDTEALHGEAVTVYETRDGWAWGQLDADGYVGYMRADALGEAPAPTHRVSVPRTFAYPGANIKLPAVMALPLNAAVCVAETRGEFAVTPHGLCLWAAHLAPLGEAAPDFVAVAETLLHVPYLWGGKTSIGLDCSGLVQNALSAAGISSPRDTDMQERGLGKAVAFDASLDGLQRGDLVFWKGHVGILRDAGTLLHASGHQMMVASEPLDVARERIAAKSYGAVTALRRP